MKTISDFILPLSTLKEGVNERKYVIGGEFFADRECSEVTDASVDAIIEIEHRHDLYKVKMTLRGSVETPCHRCLDPLSIDVDDIITFTIRYGENDEEGDDNVFVISPQTVSFDIAPLIYDSILLALPMRCVHSEGECNPEMESLIAGEIEESGEEDEDID